MTFKVFWVMFIFLIFGTCKSAVVIYIAYRQGTFIILNFYWFHHPSPLIGKDAMNQSSKAGVTIGENELEHEWQ